MPALNRVMVVAGDMATACGPGTESCWQALMDKRSAIRPVTRFAVSQFPAGTAACIDGLVYGGSADESLVMQMMRQVEKNSNGCIPADAFALTATTVGEIDLLEKALLPGGQLPLASASGLDHLARNVERLFGLTSAGAVVSAACASASAALAYGASLISRGERDCVAVFACDSVNEFVFAGFSSLLALDPLAARPFDRDRKGLSLGDAAGFIVLMSEERCRREKRAAMAHLAGWGLSNDANHMTGPSRDGMYLAEAMRQALDKSGFQPQQVGSISAHGTGTAYNDSMEMKAFKRVFPGPVPVYSVKGCTGHTSAAAGLVEALVAVRSLKERIVPPTVGVKTVDAEAAGWVSAEARPGASSRAGGSADALESSAQATLSVNAGFGGVNAALVFTEAA